MGRRADRRRANALDFSFEEKLTNEMEYETQDEDFSKKKKILIIISIVVLCIAVILIICAIKCGKKEDIVIEEPKTEEVKALQDTYEGYKVLGKINIEKLDIEQYILDSNSEDALKKGVIKLYGGTLNSYGNFCIAGHNYDNVFLKLNELTVGDKFKIIDKKLEETIYIVKDIYSVEPDDLNCLLQDEEKVEITLITCENASTKRKVVKAEEYTNSDDIQKESATNSTNKNAEENG